MRKTNEAMPIWAAVGPDGTVVKSSVGTFRAVANRWAMRHKNYMVMKIGEVKVDVPQRAAGDDGSTTKRGPGRPRKYPIVVNNVG